MMSRQPLFFVGNPISGLTSAPELLPEPWGDIGRLLPPGAGASLLRSVSFFDGAGSTGPLWTLVARAVAGLALIALAGRRARTARPAEAVGAPAAEPAPAIRVAG
jgi:hypothetical protein